ncbi:MAG: hypothetical protein ACRDNZ_20770 [Streptosporangiaceae bacterium]
MGVLAASPGAFDQPGTLGFLIVFGMAIILYFLFRSMSRHLRRVNAAAQRDAAGQEATGQEATTMITVDGGSPGSTDPPGSLGSRRQPPSSSRP